MSSTIDLVQGVLGLAQSRAGTARETSGLDYAVALTEIVYTFFAGCTLPLEPRAIQKLGIFFQVTIGDRINDGRMGWIHEPRRRPFALRCTAALAAHVTEATQAAGTSLVLAGDLDAAAQRMITEFEPSCNLPLHLDVAGQPELLEPEMLSLSTACFSLAAAIGRGLDEQVVELGL